METLKKGKPRVIKRHFNRDIQGRTCYNPLCTECIIQNIENAHSTQYFTWEPRMGKPQGIEIHYRMKNTRGKN